MAEIGRDRLLEASFVVGYDRAQPCQPVETFLKPGRGPGPCQFEHGVKGVIQGTLPGAFQGLVHGVSLGRCRP